jgi:hypothetical protein
MVGIDIGAPGELEVGRSRTVTTTSFEIACEVEMRKPVRCLLCAGWMLMMLGGRAGAQRAPSPATSVATLHQLAGVVLDSAGTAVPLADLRLTVADGRGFASSTDERGRFRIAGIPAGIGQLEVKRLGFRPYVRSVVVPQADAAGDMRIFLAPAVAQLSGIEVNESRDESDPALAGFYARRRSNTFGHSLDRAEIEATHAQRASEALRIVPGVLVQPSRRIGNVVRVRNCRPTVWLDGVRLPGAELDEVTSVDDVAAVEIYKSLAGLPQQFIDRTNPCGAIRIWSRTH